MIEVKGENRRILQIEDGFVGKQPSISLHIIGALIEPRAITVPRAELIQAIWPEGIEALRQAEEQIIYMHGKFKETGSGNKVLMQIGNVLSDVEEK